jgi:predicted DNA-binding protein (UPF0251 family)
MPRPPKCRIVASEPSVTFFKPRGIPIKKLDIVTLSVEEMEALRLKEIEGLEQDAASKKMGISRQTYGRILARARRIVASAVVMGMGLKIEGGNYTVAGDKSGKQDKENKQENR